MSEATCISQAYDFLLKHNLGQVTRDEPLFRHTSFRIGGPAALFVRAETMGDISNVLRLVKEYDMKWMVKGKGSNLLVADGGYNGIILTLGDEFTKHVLNDKGVMTCGAAVSLGRIVSESVSLGLSGLEFAVGIPGSLGGAVYMNAGTKEADISQSIETVTVVSANDGMRRYFADELNWQYRNSSIPKDEIIIEASFITSPDSKQLLSAKIETLLKKRKATQPQGMPNAGSIFKNPPGKSAGQLIERAGFKGYKVGGALVSEIHANFIVNTGGATASDVIELLKRIRKRVKEIDGIELTPEINFIGFAEGEDRSKLIS